MIRFSAFLVAAALGLLVAGVVTSKLVLVYVAIGVSGVALLALGAGALIKRNELFGQSKSAGPESVRPTPAVPYVPPAQPAPQAAPWETPVPAGSAWTPTPAAAQSAPSRAGYLPTDQPPSTPVKAQPADAAAAAWGSDFPFPPERPPERQADVQPRPAAFTPRPPAGPPPAGPPPAGPPPAGPPSPPVPGVPAPARDAGQWRMDAPATQPLREMRRPEPSAAAPQPAESAQPVRDQSSAQDQPPAQGQPPAERPEPAAPSAQEQPSVPDEPAGQAEPPTQDDRPAQHELTPQDQLPAEQAPSAAEDPGGTEAQPQDEHPAEDQQTQQTQQLPVIASTATEPAPSRPDSVAPAPDAEPAPGPAASDAAPAVSAAAKPAAATPATVDLQREVTVVPGVPRYHNPHCLLIRFMGQDDLDQMTLAAAREAGCTPCRACLPDQPEANPELSRLGFYA